MSAPYVVFARQLRDLRRGKDLTQEQAAELVGVTNSTFSRWELGQDLPGPENMRKLAEAFPSLNSDPSSYLGQIREAIDKDKLERRLRDATTDDQIAYETTLGQYAIQLLADGSLRVRAGETMVIVKA